MSKKIKKATKEKNLQAKRARKAANKAKYAALMAAGKNNKSIRSLRAGKRSRKAVGVDHPNGHCGNIACLKCFPDMERPMLNRKKVA